MVNGEMNVTRFNPPCVRVGVAAMQPSGHRPLSGDRAKGESAIQVLPALRMVWLYA